VCSEVKKIRSEPARSTVTGKRRIAATRTTNTTGKYSGARWVRFTRRKPTPTPRKEPRSTKLEK